MMTETTVLMVLLLSTLGCKSAAEKCTEAKVAAQDAWGAYTSDIERKTLRLLRPQLEAEEARCANFPEGSSERDACVRAQPGIALLNAAVDRAADGQLVKKATRGNAAELRERVRNYRTRFGETPAGPEEATWREAYQAADRQWEACKEVDP